MSAFRNSLLALALLAAASAAAREVTGEPQPLQSTPPAEPSTEADGAVYRPKPSVLGSGGEAAVQVGALGTVEGPLAGTLEDGNGGLGYAMWAGSERSPMEAMLLRLQAATPSPASRMLLRRLLLTAAPPPEGPWRTPFLSLRIYKLMEAGMLQDAAELAAQIQNSTNLEIARAQAEALLYTGRDADACGDATSYRLQDAQPFWIELRAFCYALAKDVPALELTRKVMAAQKVQDPAFVALLDAMAGAKLKEPVTVATPTALHVRMFERLNISVTAEIASAGMPESLVALRAERTPPDVRFAAAERAFRAGALPGPPASQVLGLAKFKAQELSYAAAQAPGEAPLHGLARLKAALQTQTDPGKRAELVNAAFRIGEREGLFAQVAAAFADEATALAPSPDWSNWAPMMARGLLMAGRPDAARLWFDMINLHLPQLKNSINELTLIFALGAPNEARDALAQASLSWFVDQASEPGASLDQRALAALYLGLFDALERPLSPTLHGRVHELINANLPGRRPARALLTRVQNAVAAGRRGEAVLAMLEAMGPAGPAGLAPDVTVRFVRSLQSLGLHEPARMLAAEAVIIPAPAAHG
ncbi:MAG: hypothetical protein ACT4OG_01120 [Alphaproteobacteria bacterium]